MNSYYIKNEPDQKVMLRRAGFPTIIVPLREAQRGNRHVTELFKAAAAREEQRKVAQAGRV